MSQEILIGLFTLGGVFVGSFFTMIGILIKEHNETKRALEGFTYNLAKEYWNRAVDVADKRGGAVDPLESFIISIKMLMKLTERSKVNEDEIKEILDKHRRIMSIVRKHYNKIRRLENRQ